MNGQMWLTLSQSHSILSATPPHAVEMHQRLFGTLHCLLHFKDVALIVSSYMLGLPNSKRNIRMVWNMCNAQLRL